MLYALLYAIIRRVLQLSGMSSDAEAEGLVLRHELAVLRRQIKRPNCMAPASASRSIPGTSIRSARAVFWTTQAPITPVQGR